MRKKTDVELARQRISLMVRAQASIVRAEFLNAALPAALEAFDKSLAAGEAVEVEPISIEEYVSSALDEVNAGVIGEATDAGAV